jgi:hypothetical protein
LEVAVLRATMEEEEEKKRNRNKDSKMTVRIVTERRAYEDY